MKHFVKYFFDEPCRSGPDKTKDKLFDEWQDQNRDVEILSISPTISVKSTNAGWTSSNNGFMVHYTRA
jgi:hypothetical protein